MVKEKEKNTSLTLPIIPLRGITVFPHMVTHFDVGRDKSVEAVEEAMLSDSLLFLAAQKDATIGEPEYDDFYHIGTISKIKQVLRLPGGTIRVLVEGLNRGIITEFLDNQKYIEGVIVEDKEEAEYIEINDQVEAMKRLIIDGLREYSSLSPKISDNVVMTVEEIEQPGKLADIVASYLALDVKESQKILEKYEPYERLEQLYETINRELELLRIEEELDKKIRSKMGKVQKEYYLREKLRAIQEELDEEDEISEDSKGYEEKIKEIGFDENIEKKLLKEVDRFKTISPHSQESGVIQTYLDWIVDLPWNKESEEILDIKKSREILDKDHYGLKEVKERILEFLAVRQFTDSIKGPILCLVGPPGVGKTSIARSVADSMNREFVRMSLGGVRDEAEIRGHRRTYVGSMPGRIINSIKEADTKNPVFLLDEIDKIGSDFRGDPASALLEVLDPEQNSTFKDHYLDVPFDLSKVMFITTANSLSTIPRPLLDRMEVIEINSYIEDEKVEIAKRYLIPKQMKEHGLEENQLQISDKAVVKVIRNYTREAGVRNLERQIANICRKAVKKMVEEKKDTVRVNISNLEKYLGVEAYIQDTLNEDNQVGLVTGLAWTQVGGETLSIEVNIVEGSGKVQLTGKLGDVMKESAMAGISYIRSNYKRFNIERDFYETKDIHIHVPEGAVPKDGPSAGITIATAVISALTNTPVHHNLAMTGEVTLRGRVLPIGGVKEKTVAANRLGIKKVLLPIDNKKELEEVPDKVKSEIEFVLVSNMDEVLEHALVKDNDKNENN
ncbi:MAG TPA: endopeptidase La [Tissierellaceae bacterium]